MPRSVIDASLTRFGIDHIRRRVVRPAATELGQDSAIDQTDRIVVGAGAAGCVVAEKLKGR